MSVAIGDGSVASDVNRDVVSGQVRFDDLAVVVTDFFFFFFSSRRRHTRFDCDWSSDVCSSDLFAPGFCRAADLQQAMFHRPSVMHDFQRAPLALGSDAFQAAAEHANAVSQKRAVGRSEEHTSELQSQSNLVCRLLLEKKK